MKRILLALAVLAAAILSAAPASAKPSPSSLTVVGPFGAGSPEVIALEAEFAAFTSANRVEVIYEEHFGQADLEDRVTGPSPPDLIITHQPDQLESLAPDLVDLAEFVNPVALRRDFGDYLIDVATVDATMLGAPIKAHLNSLVWYQPAIFEANGYAIPESFDELVALSDQMLAGGERPWCNYIGSFPSTGWMGTDWVEDLVLGTCGGRIFGRGR